MNAVTPRTIPRRRHAGFAYGGGKVHALVEGDWMRGRTACGRTVRIWNKTALPFERHLTFERCERCAGKVLA